MTGWLRETAGWLLTAIGLWFLYQCASVLLLRDTTKVVEAGELTLIGVIVFRGGIGLLKSALAARVATRAARMERPEPVPPARTAPRRA
jgi:RsiW-degrading membrane proteinase PrsW (M82 family)